MNVSATNRADRAICAALKEFGGGESAALTCLFLKIAARLGAIHGSERISELAYGVADRLATVGDEQP